MTARPATSSGAAGGRILTVSNRGPVEFHRDEDDQVIAVPGRGGLATALRAAARFSPTTWLASPLTPVDRAIAMGECAPCTSDGIAHFVATDAAAYDRFYGLFSNQVLWMLQHGLDWPEELTAAARDDAWQNGYLPINQAFADAIVKELDTGAYRAVILHDYLFYATAAMVREARPKAYLQQFIHIPWPEPREWSRLDTAIVAAICRGLLGNDSVVFQTPDAAANFLATCEAYLPDAGVSRAAGSLEIGGRVARVWANAISIDPQELDEAAASPEFSRHRWLLRAKPGQKTIVRVDRLDPSKNVIRGFEAYRLLLRKHPELREKVYFLALLVPSRSDIPAYQRYQEDAHAIVDRINREFGNNHWKPVRLIFEHNRMQALAAMSLYDVLIVNSVADGMNLVAKEGPMLNLHEGALVLSTRAGAYAELGCAAIGIDPEDVGGTAAALYTALMLPPVERRERAQRLKKVIRGHDLQSWFTALLADIEARTPATAPTSSSAA